MAWWHSCAWEQPHIIRFSGRGRLQKSAQPAEAAGEWFLPPSRSPSVPGPTSLAREGRPSSKDFIITARWVGCSALRPLDCLPVCLSVRLTVRLSVCLHISLLARLRHPCFDLSDRRRQRPSPAIARRLHSLVVHTHYTVTTRPCTHTFGGARSGGGHASGGLLALLSGVGSHYCPHRVRRRRQNLFLRIAGFTPYPPSSDTRDVISRCRPTRRPAGVEVTTPYPVRRWRWRGHPRQSLRHRQTRSRCVSSTCTPRSW